MVVMKNIVLLFLFLVPVFLFAQYPTGTNKSRLGYQTTGDGLIWRGVAADTAIKPRTTANAYFQLDTVNRVLRRYIATQGSWQVVGGGSTNVDSLIYATRYWVGSNFFSLQGGTLTGTGGAGFIGFPSQVSAPGTPASGLNVYAQGSSFNWKGTDGYERQFASTLTGGRTYTLPNVSGTFALGTGTANLVSLWTATNTLGSSNIQDNNTVVSILNSKPFALGQWTTAGRPSGTSGYMGYNTTLTGIDWYNGTRWATALESTFARGTSGYFPRFDANGQIIDSEARVSSTNMIIALTGGLQIPSGTSAQQSSTGAGYLRWNTSLAYPTIFNGSSTQSVLIGPFTGFASGEVMYGAASGGMPSSATTFKWDIANSRLLVGATSHTFANTTRLVVQQATSNAFIADFRSTAATVFGPIAAMKLTRTDNTVGYGTTFAFYFNNAASAEVDYARFGSYIESNTTGSHSGGLAFYTTNLATTTQERFRVTSIGRMGINTTSPTHRLHVNGRVRIDTTDSTPTSIIGVDGNNVLGKFTLGSGLSISSGTLSATGTGGTVTSVGLSLPSIFSVTGSPVTTSGILSASFTSSTTSHVLRGDGDWANSLDYFKINQSLSSVERFEVNGNLVLSREDEGHKLMLSRGWSQQIWGGGSSGDMTYQNGSGPGFQNYFVIGTSAGTDTALTMHSNGIGAFIGKFNKIQARLHIKGSSSAGSAKTALFEDTNGTDVFTIIDNGRIQMHGYGTGTKEAADLSKTQSAYIAGFATDGAVLDLNVDTLLKKEKYFTITSTSSPQTLSNNFSDNLINQGGTQATFTLTFPASPVDGQVLKITYNNAITTLTLDGNGNTIVGSAVTTGVAGSQRAFKFYTGIGWIKLY